MKRRAVVAVAAGAVVVAGAGAVVAVQRSGDRTTFGLASDPVVVPETLVPTDGVSPLPTSSPPLPTVVPTAEVPEPTSVPPSVPASVPASADPGGPRPLPTNCISYGHFCAYPGGQYVHDPDWVESELVARDEVRVSWRPWIHPKWPPVEDFVVQAYRYGPEDVQGDMARGMRDPDHVTRVRVGLPVRSYTFRDLIPGARYLFCVFQVNSHGIGGLCGGDHTIAHPPTPEPTPSRTPTPTPSATVTPSATPSETAEPTASASAAP